MATKLYLESSGTPNISPTPNAGWTDTTQFARYKCGTTKLSSAMVTDDVTTAISTQADIIIGQWISDFLDVGQTITGAQAVNIVARAAEVATNNNLFLTWAVYVFNGTTLQKTVVTKRTDATEVAATTLTSRTDAATSVAGDYTTVQGDRLVIEVGLSGDPAGSNTHNGSLSFGSDSATDLTMADGTTTANNPNVILTDTLTFNTSSPSPSVSPSVSPSASTSPSPSTSPSLSPSASTSQSSSESPSISPSASISPSSSESPSTSPSASVSPSSSASPSVSPSGSTSPSASESPSTSPSGSVSPSSSASPSVSPSASESPSVSPSVSPSESVSPSASTSPSASGSPSASISPSPPPPPPDIVFLDPGGDAVQVAGYFSTVTGSGTMSFDTAQKVVGVGSWKFDSGAGNNTVESKVANVLGQGRRISAYFRYDALLNTNAVAAEFPGTVSSYPDPLVDTGFNISADQFNDDDGAYATATPAKNGFKASIVAGFHASLIPLNSIIDSVKIIYERKYDVNTSIGISRVKWAIGVDAATLTETGPDHDNTDMPLTDTVVTVDITNERTWERADFDLLHIIVEARRGDSDTSHTQSWDYVKVEVAYHTAIDILSCRRSTVVEDVLKLAVLPVSTGAILRVVNIGASGIEGAVFDGSTILLPDANYRITLSFFQNATDDLDVKVFVDGVEELTVPGGTADGQAIGQWPDLYYGWIGAPGANQICWFDQIYIDQGDDLTDPGNILMTAKLPAAVNVGNFDTTVGTGAVDERPVSLTNHMRQNAITQVFQNYTLQAASVGDVDISAETYVGHMGWVIVAKISGSSTGTGITVNGTTTAIAMSSLTSGAVTFFRKAVTGSVYPSDAAGIGARSFSGTSDMLLYECGVVVAYQGPTSAALLPYQLLAQDSTTGASDDMGGLPPASYELRSQVDASAGVVVATTISSSGAPGEVPQQQAVIESYGGEEVGMVTFNPGEEVSVSVAVTGNSANVELRRAPNNE